MDHNPYLKPSSRPFEVGGKGRTIRPEDAENMIWQTRWAPPTDYENQLGDALEVCFSEGVEEVEALVARLNEMSVLSPDGSQWTVESFEREMERLGG